MKRRCYFPYCGLKNKEWRGDGGGDGQWSPLSIFPSVPHPSSSSRETISLLFFCSPKDQDQDEDQDHRFNRSTDPIPNPFSRTPLNQAACSTSNIAFHFLQLLLLIFVTQFPGTLQPIVCPPPPFPHRAPEPIGLPPTLPWKKTLKHILDHRLTASFGPKNFYTNNCRRKINDFPITSSLIINRHQRPLTQWHPTSSWWWVQKY